jgi:hypothetical protein
MPVSSQVLDMMDSVLDDNEISYILGEIEEDTQDTDVDDE